MNRRNNKIDAVFVAVFAVVAFVAAWWVRPDDSIASNFLIVLGVIELLAVVVAWKGW